MPLYPLRPTLEPAPDRDGLQMPGKRAMKGPLASFHSITRVEARHLAISRRTQPRPQTAIRSSSTFGAPAMFADQPGGALHNCTVPWKESSMTIVGILIVIILVLLAIYLFQRVRGGGARRL